MTTIERISFGEGSAHFFCSGRPECGRLQAMGKSIEAGGRVIRMGERVVMAAISAACAAVLAAGLSGPLGWVALAGLAGGAFRLYAAWLGRRLPQRALGFSAAGQLIAGLAALAVSLPVGIWAAYLLLSAQTPSLGLLWGWLMAGGGALLLAASARRGSQWALARRQRKLPKAKGSLAELPKGR